jgi:hypothetical protein
MPARRGLRHTGRRALLRVGQLLGAACCAGGLAGCLPEATPGIGERVLAGRGMADVMFGDVGSPPRLLFTRERTTVVTDPAEAFFVPRDLFMVTAGGEPALVAKDLDVVLGRRLRWDGRGRLVLRYEAQVVDNLATAQVALFDPASGELERLGRARTTQLSGDGQWLLRQLGDGTVIARTLDGRERMLGLIKDASFAGADLLYRVEKNLLRYGRDDDSPRQIESDVERWRVRPGVAPGVFVHRSVGGMNETVNEWSLIDLDGVAPPRVLATDRGPTNLQSSADGTQVAVLTGGPARGIVRMHVIPLAGGEERTVDLTVPPPIDSAGREQSIDVFSVSFRPGTSEVWCFVEARLYVLAGDGSLTFVDRAVEVSSGVGPARRGDAGLFELPVQTESLFTADGKRWIFRSGNKVLLGDADHPSSEEGMLVSMDVFAAEITELPGGMLVFEDRPSGGGRRDLYVAEPPYEGRRLLVRDVAETIFGHGRVLALSHKIGGDNASSSGTGDMSIVDLASGGETILARNVTDVAVPRVCADCDPIAPGTPLLYGVQARVPFKYDGLWLGTVP